MREWSQGELKVISIVPRVAASIGLASATVLGLTAYRHIRRQQQQQQQRGGGGGGTRSLLYHRFMVALSCHLCLFSAANVVGTAAIPAGTTNTWGATGTTGTCSAQGFVLQLSLTAPFYYVLLSLYSFLAVWNNFSVEKYTWVEPWIHVSVHVFPVGSAIYLLSLEAYNQPGEHPGTTCWIDSLPFGCGDGNGDGDDDNDPNNNGTVPCTRGPQNISQVAGIFAGLPVLFIMVFPVLVMSALVWQVVRHQARIQISATAVAKQAAVYIGALYWSYALTIIGHTRGWKANETSDSMALQLGGTITMNLIGFWFLLIYFYFWMPSTNNSTQQQQRQQEASNESSLPNDAQSVPPSEKCRTTTTPTSRSTSPRITVVPAFNIFDGTNATGEFADYIFDGDSEDERVDQAESLHWNDIQNHV